MPLPSFMMQGIPQQLPQNASMMPPAPMQLGGLPQNMSVEDMHAAHQAGSASLVPQTIAQQGYPPPSPAGTAEGTGGMVPPISPITGEAPGAVTFGKAIGQYQNARARQSEASQQFDQGINQEQQALADQGAAQMDLNDVEAQKGDAMQGIDREREAVTSEYEKRRGDLMAQYDKQNAVQLKKMQAAVDEAGQANIQNFWADKSTGARILGVIAQALSGAANGLAGNPSAPTALDRIINDDLQRQMANQQNKRTVAGQQQSLYDSMLRATGNRLDAETGMYQAANNRIAALAQTLTDKMATPTAIAQNKLLQANLQQRNAQLLEKRAEMQQTIATHDVDASMRTMLGAEQLGAMSGAAATKAAGKAEDTYNPLPGTMSGIPKSKTTGGIYAKQVKAAEDIVSYLSSLEAARQSIAEGKLGLESYYQLAAAADLQFSAQRGDGMLALGKKLEGSEEAMAKRGAVGYVKSYIAGDITKANAAIDAYEMEWGRAYLNRLRAANPNLQVDYNAPVIGPILQRVVTMEDHLRHRQVQSGK